MTDRIKRVFNKGKSGEPLSVAFIGGSITQGCNSTRPESCYAYLTYDWFKKSFPDSQVSYINAGIGGTTSLYGVARVKDHVLSHNPDIVFVEFSVNDENTAFFKETYESLIRRIYEHESKPAIMIIHNVVYDSGVSAEEIHHELAEYYHIPSVSMKTNIYEKLIRDGVPFTEITGDGLHPNDKGHKMVADIICNKLEELLQKSGDLLPEQVTENHYVNSTINNATNCEPKLNGFIKDPREKREFLDIFSNGWIGRSLGDEITFTFDCSCIFVQYKKTINRPSPVCSLILDDDEEHPFILDSNFDQDWGDELHIDNILISEEKNIHTARIKVEKVPADAKSDFYLVAMIVA